MANFIYKTGAYPDPADPRDYKAEEIMGVAKYPTFEQGYSVENEIGKLKIEDQGQSGSCVSQAFSKYAEVLNLFETKKFTDLSARDIYSRIYLPQGGAYLRAGAKTLVKHGDAEERLVPSYMNGNPPTEDFMRQKVDTPIVLDNAAIYRAKAYARIYTHDINTVAQAIYLNHGVATGATGSNQGWATGNVRPPKAGEDTWGHAIYCAGYGIDGLGKYIEFINSWSVTWGFAGRGRIHEDYFASGKIFSLWTLVDLPNTMQAKLIHKDLGDKKIWAVIRDKRYWVLDPETLDRGSVIWGDWSQVKMEDPSKYEYGGAIFISNTDDPLKL